MRGPCCKVVFYKVGVVMNDVWLPGTKTLKPLWEKTRERTLHMSTLPLQIGPVKYHLKTFVDAYQH